MHLKKKQNLAYMEVSTYYRFPAFISFNYKISWEEGRESRKGQGKEQNPSKKAGVWGGGWLVRAVL